MIARRYPERQKVVLMRRFTLPVLVGMALMAFFAVADSASANLDRLASYSATTTTGQTCYMNVLGGSSGRELFGVSMSQSPFSKVDYGVTLNCPSGTLAFNDANATLSTNATDPGSDAFCNGLGIQPYPGYQPKGFCGRTTCQHFSVSNANSCTATSSDTMATPGDQYAISGGFYFASVVGDGAWSSLPSICTYDNSNGTVSCTTPNFYVTG
jgi:hypothetical protein